MLALMKHHDSISLANHCRPALTEFTIRLTVRTLMAYLAKAKALTFCLGTCQRAWWESNEADVRWLPVISLVSHAAVLELLPPAWHTSRS